MNYQKTLDYILEQLPMYQRIGKAAFRSGLENTLKLDEYFKHAHRAFKTIHIAGTNGKGSVSHMLASVLQEAGYKVGLYTSPHLIDFRERIRLNGRMIPKEYVTRFIRQHKAFFASFSPSFFEISVFLAFEYFRENHVDIAVIEVGLGGRLDATNIITPELSVITNIGKDHVEILGDTLPRIALEKAGIIKPNTPIVIGESQTETLPVFSGVASTLNAPMTVADKKYTIDYSLKSLDGYQVFNVHLQDGIRYTNLKCGLNGHYQRKNAVTVLAAIDELIHLGIPIKEKELFTGIRNVVENTGLSGRWQVVRHNPTVVCDTAHNADGLKLVIQQVTETAGKKLHMVIGFVNDKDVHEILKFMPSRANYYFVRLSVPRTMNEMTLATEAKKYGLKGQTFADIRDAYDAVNRNAAKEDMVIVTGSNFLVADFLSLLNIPIARKKYTLKNCL
jgi:dihydrofolate synthase / folylpolyglutamate synthase